MDQGLDLEAQDNDGDTPLHRAVLDGRIATARFLFEQGANPHIKTKNIKTPLGWAKQRSGFFTFSLNRLIKDFEAYTPPPDTSQSDTSETAQSDTGQSDNVQIKSDTPPVPQQN